MTNNMCFCVIVYCTLFVIAYFITTHNVNVKCRRQHSIQQRSHFVYLEDISQFALPNGIWWHKHLVIRHTTWRGIIRDQRRPRQKNIGYLCVAPSLLLRYTRSARFIHDPDPDWIVMDKKLSYRWGTARCVASVEILPTATQQCRNYSYDKSWTKYSCISCR